jgi:nitrate/TMAO reductase-like tetraheme cytochrome c subunit
MRKNKLQGLKSVAQRGYIITGGIVTRNYVAADNICMYCHVPWEYLHSARMSFSKTHPPELKEDQTPAHCVDCHLPKGLINTTYAYTHYASVTDLFGHFRDREDERAGDWIPLSAARAYRVRDRLMEYDSKTCRTCHVMEEIVPDSIRGQTAHKDAVANGETCIECHSNLVHRFVEIRLVETAADEEGGGGGGGEAVDEFDEFGETPDEGLDEESEEEIL